MKDEYHVPLQLPYHTDKFHVYISWRNGQAVALPEGHGPVRACGKRNLLRECKGSHERT